MTVVSNYLCFRVWCWDLDPEVIDQIGFRIQEYGGWISARRACVDFWVPRDRASFLILKYGDYLERQAVFDYV